MIHAMFGPSIPGKKTLHILQKARKTPKLFCADVKQRKSLAPTRIRSPDCQAPGESLNQRRSSDPKGASSNQALIFRPGAIPPGPKLKKGGAVFPRKFKKKQVVGPKTPKKTPWGQKPPDRNSKLFFGSGRWRVWR